MVYTLENNNYYGLIMIIVLGFSKEDAASAGRLATRYHEVIVIKDLVLQRRQNDFQKAVPALTQEDLANLSRITILGHSDSTKKFGSYTVKKFTDFICDILRVNGNRLTSLRNIDLLGCEVGRTEHREIVDFLETDIEYRSFVNDFVVELAHRISAYIENDLNICAYSTPNEHSYRKTLLYEDISDDENVPGTWRYLGLDEEQYQEYRDLEKEEKIHRNILGIHKSNKAENDIAIEEIQELIHQAPEDELINLNSSLSELIDKGLKIDAKIQASREALQQKHLEIRAYLLNHTTQIVTETDDPRLALESQQFGRFLIRKVNMAEEKYSSAALVTHVENMEECVMGQLELKEKLSDMKRVIVSDSDEEQDNETDLSIPQTAPGKDGH